MSGALKSSNAANEFIKFVNASPSPFHAVATVRSRLIALGFEEISERQQWNTNTIKPSSKYFFTRNGSSIVAFAVGGQWKPGNAIGIVGAHTDSPCLRVKPVSKSKSNVEGYKQVGVECYGGGIWHSWFDRDLSVAGRLLVNDSNGNIRSKLVRIDKPILRIPTLAIHLDRDVNTKFEFNKETQLNPILGLVEQELNVSASSKTENEINKVNVATSLEIRHDNSFLSLVARTAQVEISAIEDFELLLFDTQPSCIGGINDEFIFSPRLDNLNSSFTAIEGLIESLPNLNQESSISMVALFDHEEIGSQSAQGADSNLLPATLTRLASLGSAENTNTEASNANSLAYETFAKSILISADMAHAVHPNYSSKHENNHKPQMNRGPVIKINANQRYATNSAGTVLLKKIADQNNIPLQLFVVRNDSACGSTIGPIIAAKLGIRTIDIGNAQLSMHSIRETSGTEDIAYSISLFKGFFEKFVEIDQTIFTEEF
ncbi:aspartyl aminopeptidase [Nadsonia fulvescens var. elongata DSM 6958]|uniref:aspartyl aminopeptidase n=1 Tax=Nadsonia fulvescens var. elongata DSM 6958 TaxID=857566 RepID=A0A1E3PIP0_9ASCO|nr:aspartyl aminopeptidase [Nadsonia fulvescens var. elongata DSM 6958]